MCGMHSLQMLYLKIGNGYFMSTCQEIKQAPSYYWYVDIFCQVDQACCFTGFIYKCIEDLQSGTVAQISYLFRASVVPIAFHCHFIL